MKEKKRKRNKKKKKQQESQWNCNLLCYCLFPRIAYLPKDNTIVMIQPFNWMEIFLLKVFY